MLLQRMYTEADIARDFIVPEEKKGVLPSPFVADFIIVQTDGSFTLVEAKAPYTEQALSGLERTIRRLRRTILNLPASMRLKEIVLAVASRLNDSTRRLLSSAAAEFEKLGVLLSVWDSGRLTELFQRYYGQRVLDFSPSELKHLVFIQGARYKEGRPEPKTRNETDEDAETEGEMVVMFADFCSYSSFVRESRRAYNLAKAVMGRFYREVRATVESLGGRVDKFIGDGVLIFWDDVSDRKILAQRIDDCARRLIGLSLKLAAEWQEQIDIEVTPTGMRVGAAMGHILLIPETNEPNSPAHAVGEAINMSVRLAGREPNTLCITNTLRRNLFPDDVSFEQQDPVVMKNMGGQVRYWSKKYTNEAAGVKE